MANGQRLSQKEQEVGGWIFLIIGVILAILVMIIMLARFVFWSTVVLFFISIGYLIVGIFIDIHRVRNYEDYFDCPHSLIALGLILLFWVVAHFSFPVGYSEFSYQIIEWNDDYKEFRGLPYQVTIEALNQTCVSIPDAPSCSMILESYKSAEQISEISDTAKAIQGIFNLKLGAK